MHRALTYLGQLPPSTTVYNGHEYTAGSAKFGAAVDGQNARVQELVQLAKHYGDDKANGGCTGKSTIGDELDWNVFMRLESEPVKWVRRDGEVYSELSSGCGGQESDGQVGPRVHHGQAARDEEQCLKRRWCGRSRYGVVCYTASVQDVMLLLELVRVYL